MKPRRFGILIILLSLTGLLRGQSVIRDIFDSPMFDNAPEDFLRIGLTTNNYFLEDGSFQSYGIRIEGSVDKHWTALWNIRFLANNTLRGTHMPLGLRAAAVIIEGSSHSHTHNGEGLVALMALCAIVPEGVGYKIHPEAKIQVMPYLSPLGMDREVRLGASPSAPGHFKLSGTAGVEFQSNMATRLYAGFDLHTTLIYKTGRVEPAAAFIVGFCFRN